MSRQQLRTRAGCISLGAINPENGAIMSVFMRMETAEKRARRGRHAVAEITQLVPWALLNPAHIYEGARRDEEQGSVDLPEAWIIYAAVPEFAFDRVNSVEKTSPRDGQVYLVTVYVDKIVYHWRWDLGDPNDSTRPAGYADRYEKELL